MTFDAKLKTLQFVNHLAIIPFFIFLDWGWVIVTIVFHILFEGIGTSVGLHRFFTHKSFKTYKPIEWILGFLGTISTLGTIRSWCYSHRYHHVNSDTELDPHSPHHTPLLKNWFHNFGMPNRIRPSLLKDLIENPVVEFFTKHYFKVIGTYVVLLVIIDPLLIVYCYSVPAVLAFHSASLVNNVCHLYGYRNFPTKDVSTNNHLVAWLTNGEGYHNNHHGKPAKWDFTVNENEFDLGAWIVKGIKK